MLSFILDCKDEHVHLIALRWQKDPTSAVKGVDVVDIIPELSLVQHELFAFTCHVLQLRSGVGDKTTALRLYLTPKPDKSEGEGYASF
jgi:hypothetical protein